jgi:cell division ATPase FtsA
LTILGHAECPSVGICKGTIVNSDGAKECIRHAILAADVFGVPARLGGPPSSVIAPLRDPSYNTVLGLFHYNDLGARGIADSAK